MMNTVILLQNYSKNNFIYIIFPMCALVRLHKIDVIIFLATKHNTHGDDAT